MDWELEPWFGAIRRLQRRGPGCTGLAIDEDGATLGPDVPLVWKRADGYRAARVAEFGVLFRHTFGWGGEAETAARYLVAIAGALGSRNLAKARSWDSTFPFAS